MTTWKDRWDHDKDYHEIVNEDGESICRVWTGRHAYLNNGDVYKWGIEPWPESEANFRLILQAPQMLEALEAIVDLHTDDLWRSTGIARAAIAAVKGEEGNESD